jgi:hypothetical protein
MTAASGADEVSFIAGEVPLVDVMAGLRHDRPVFHSEADLQHAFARVLWDMAPVVGARLEVRQHVSDRAERLDLLCVGPSLRTAIEFKYRTRAWNGVVGPLGETYALGSHSATDLARLSFVSDVERLERFCDWPDQNAWR